ncbi:DUF3467 domain-containing protein [Candidatus Saganbacteria bacterium CG08_land_8_20_14_0_20_45_16]|uniref:DUF3467 domain-containing protein n=1 Tax=Candidatus Saganbacteria bacterium CG08_land_8_20_14_0_20_45_16 TaxID=2014293 RepID=A0A2H0XV97_UNCSA|nr:MAG: DUF3467 domain-containing protein [Candidatus Saganbacteria bacterium CG08_land_8_20_14_0_20_45_16]
MENKESKIEIEVGSEVVGGKYSNLAVISHNENEFIMDFIFAHPPKGKVNARVIMSPSHAKQFLKALKENVEKYEQKTGDTKKPPEPPAIGIEFSKN